MLRHYCFLGITFKVIKSGITAVYSVIECTRALSMIKVFCYSVHCTHVRYVSPLPRMMANLSPEEIEGVGTISYPVFASSSSISG